VGRQGIRHWVVRIGCILEDIAFDRKGTRSASISSSSKRGNKTHGVLGSVVVYQKLQNGSTAENANEPIQGERICDVEIKDNLSELQAPEASASVMNDLIQEKP